MQGIRSSIAVPLIHSDELLGVMVLDSQVAANAFSEKDLQLTQAFANQAAVAIQNGLFAAKIERRFSNGYQVNFAYTWGQARGFSSARDSRRYSASRRAAS